MKNNYNTQQRKTILEYLMNHSDKYINVDDIFKYMSEKKYNVGLTTIYRYLKLLEKQGSLRTETIENTKHYQYISDECKNHYHLKCKSCGNIIHLDCKEFEKINKHIQNEHNFHISDQTMIYGICDKCYKK